MSKPSLSLLAVVLLAASAAGPVLADTPAAGPGDVLASASDVEARLDRLQREIASTDAELERVRSQSDMVRQRMLARGRSWYKVTHVGMLPLGSGFEGLVAHTTRAERLRRAVERDVEAASALDRQRLALLEQKQKLTSRKVPLEMQHKALAQARAMVLEASDRERAFDRAFASSTGADYTAIYGVAPAAGPSAPDDGLRAGLEAGFRVMKGRLPFPLAGRAEVRQVSRPGAGGPGVEMRAPSGSAVRAVFAGRVAFADEYANYGRVVIVDHGDHYFSVCGNLGTIEVRVGDDLAAGNRLGNVGAGGLLYFELRHGADTLDPGPWFGI